MNALGTVAGTNGQAFTWRRHGGYLPRVPLAGHTNGTAEDVNRAGFVAGRSYTGTTSVATLWNPLGVPLAITVPGATNSSASALSNSGFVVGNSDLSQYGSAWIWDAVNGARSLSTFGLDPSYTATDVNELGQVVGGRPFGHAYRFDLATATFRDLGTLGSGPYSEAHGVKAGSWRSPATRRRPTPRATSS